jgi:hypothetical protein
MKFITLNILCKKFVEQEEQDDSYLNVLADLNITSDEDYETEFKPFSVNVKTLEDEVLHICDRDGSENQSVVEFFDNRTFVVNLSREELVTLLSDTK